MIPILLLIALLPGHDPETIDRTETVHRVISFEASDGTRKLLVDNLSGSITVIAYDGADVVLDGTRTTRADSENDLEDAAREVQLDIRTRDNRIAIVVDAPWRDPWGSWGHSDRDFYGYAVEYEFTLKVPRSTDLYLRTVEGGDISVDDVGGTFQIKNVNGAVRLTNIAGSGEASTVNGSLRLLFRENPTGDCAFRTVNGRVDVSFLPSFSADIAVKTFNGEAYTDFDYQLCPPEPVRKISRNGRSMYRWGTESVVRVGDGGPRISFDTLNGDIEIRKRTN